MQLDHRLEGYCDLKIKVIFVEFLLIYVFTSPCDVGCSLKANQVKNSGFHLSMRVSLIFSLVVDVWVIA